MQLATFPLKKGRMPEKQEPAQFLCPQKEAEDAAGARVQSELALYSNVEAMKSNKKHGQGGSAQDSFALCFC